MNLLRIGIGSTKCSNLLIRNKIKFNLINRRAFIKPIQVKNPRLILLSRISNQVGKAILILYFTSITLLVGTYAWGVYYADRYQDFKGISVKSKTAGRAGIINEVMYEDDENASGYYLASLKIIAEEEGLPIEPKSDDSPLLSDEILNTKSSEFVDTYIDLVGRVGITKISYGDEKGSKFLNEAIKYADKGSRYLKSEVYYTLAEIEPENCQEYLLKSIDLLVPESTGSLKIKPSAKDPKVLTVTEDSTINRDILVRLESLATWYAKNKEYEKSLTMLLSMLKRTTTIEYENTNEFKAIARQNQKEDFNTRYESALLKSYIAEILWKLNMKQDAINWCKRAGYEAYVDSRRSRRSATISANSFKTLGVMAANVGDEELKGISDEMVEKIVIPEHDINSKWGWLTILLRGS